MNSPTRTNKGQFLPGVSGNPQGRPRSENAVIREQLNSEADAIISVIIDKAKEGDMAAAKIILDRILPPLKPTSPPVTVSIPGKQSPIDYASAILAAAASGAISSDIAAQLIGATTNLTRIIEAEDIKARLEALERITKK